MGLEPPEPEYVIDHKRSGMSHERYLGMMKITQGPVAIQISGLHNFDKN
jgi:hypothetical protein